ncbi:SDR family oxidoreductase [Mangrovimicrobium sediminis]|uniref:SDR family oxidoreductase n=1 Tax=Mangrovimicrobium sediminis TaxID=2562682 RepID=A0A4Z0M8J4_9GAMM|nr:SDR family oxidoreductase [Haliea sp. SAOS-164]TGD75697.1 SDR family oxidoreductase [Haliea sp. SAOS-164]
MRLKHKTALVTGAARGLGAAICRAFAAEGAQVVVTDVDETAGAALAAELGGIWQRLDVGDEDNWIAVMAQLRERGVALDILVNNAGVIGIGDGAPQDPEHGDLASWHAVHRINLDGTFLGCKYAIRAMRERGRGSIINMSSRAGLIGVPAAAAYASSKAAVRNHTKTVALYCAQQGLDIRCNSIHPGSIMTPLWDPVLGEGSAREAAITAFTAGTPMARFGTPEEITPLVVLLASDESTYTTGAEFHIDGGALAG